MRMLEFVLHVLICGAVGFDTIRLMMHPQSLTPVGRAWVALSVGFMTLSLMYHQVAKLRRPR
jgi:hypothetical protein